MFKTIKGVGGLPYVEVHNVPMKMHPKYGEGLDASVIKRMEDLTVKSLLTQAVPLRGKEIAFIRRHLGLSMKEFGNLFNYSDVAVLKWERAPRRRLDVATEHYIRLILVRDLGIHVDAMTLLGGDKTPETLPIEWSDSDWPMSVAYYDQPGGFIPLNAVNLKTGT